MMEDWSVENQLSWLKIYYPDEYCEFMVKLDGFEYSSDVFTKNNRYITNNYDRVPLDYTCIIAYIPWVSDPKKWVKIYKDCIQSQKPSSDNMYDELMKYVPKFKEECPEEFI